MLMLHSLSRIRIPSATTIPHSDHTPFASNDDWDQQPNAGDIETAIAQVGAFPLPRGSLDAAHLAELPPGGYTVHLRAGGDASGTGLLEIYRVTR